MARLGFLLFGLAVIWLTSIAGVDWGRWGSLLHGSFGVLMVATATFSHRPFEPGLVFDRTEDLLHSVTATVMGFAFAFGVVLVSLRRTHPISPQRLFDVVAVGASILIPLGMTVWGEYAGVLQRAMFLVAYAWYAAESLRGVSSGPGLSEVDDE